MLVHYLSKNEDDAVMEISEADYKEMLTTLDGSDLAKSFIGRATVVDSDPRPSLLDKCDVFFPYNDIYNGYVTVADLLADYQESVD